MVAEFDAVVGVVTDRLRSLPAALGAAKEQARCDSFSVSQKRLANRKGKSDRAIRPRPTVVPPGIPHPAGRCPRRLNRCGLREVGSTRPALEKRNRRGSFRGAVNEF